MKHKTKDTISVWSAIILIVFGMAIVTAGFIVDPTGEVHSSALWTFGQCLIYAGSIFGITTYVNGKFNNMKDELNDSLNDLNNNPKYENNKQKTDNQ